jgi:hypothetical protein
MLFAHTHRPRIYVGTGGWDLPREVDPGGWLTCKTVDAWCAGSRRIEDQEAFVVETGELRARRFSKSVVAVLTDASANVERLASADPDWTGVAKSSNRRGAAPPYLSGVPKPVP